MTQKNLKIRSSMGETNIPHNPVKTWNVSDNSGFEIPPNAQESHPDEMPPPGEITNPYYNPQKNPYYKSQQNFPRQENLQNQYYTETPVKQPINQPTTVEEALKAREEFARQGQMSEAVKLEQAKRRVDMLIGFGVSCENVEIKFEDTVVIYELRTLKGKHKRLLSSFTEQNGTVLPDFRIVMRSDVQHEFRNLCLAYSITSVNGIDINEILGTIELKEKDQIQAKKEYVEELDDALKMYLFERFEKLTSDHDLKFNPKTEEEVQEVTKQFSKSSEGSSE
jgi:hypothetical protein